MWIIHPTVFFPGTIKRKNEAPHAHFMWESINIVFLNLDVIQVVNTLISYKIPQFHGLRKNTTSWAACFDLRVESVWKRRNRAFSNNMFYFSCHCFVYELQSSPAESLKLKRSNWGGKVLFIQGRFVIIQRSLLHSILMTFVRLSEGRFLTSTLYHS